MPLHMLMSAAPHWPDYLSKTLTKTDALLLVGDGVYLSNQVAHLHNVFAREKDLIMRGLSAAENTTLITDEQWVALTLIHQPVVSWS